MQPEQEQLTEYIEKHGKHASSLITLLPHFQSYWSKDALLRYYPDENIFWGAHGPLNGSVEAVKDFFLFAKSNNKLGLISPVDQELTTSLKDTEFSIKKIGQLPIFELSQYFKDRDPLDSLPIARSLKRRGTKLFVIKGSDCQDPLKEKFSELIYNWEKDKGLAFLCRTMPMKNFEKKTFFYLENKDEITALVTALPFANDKFYFCDYIRGENARAGSIEFLIVEGMKYLRDLSIKEVHLGLCPLVGVDKPWWGKVIFKKNLFYNFQGIYQFKKKLKPTRWETQYLVASRELKLLDYKHILEVILDKKMSTLLTDKMKNIFILRPQWRRSLPNTNLFSRISLTLGFSMIFICLHYLRQVSPFLENIYIQSAYTPNAVTAAGFWLSPFFHLHQFHLWGDQLSFLLLGAIFEYFTGKKITLLVIAVGLWLSNPLAVLMVKPLLEYIPKALEFLMQERDYGSSNAVYSLAGALSGILVKRKWLFIPFLLNAIAFLFLKESLLAFHHLTGLLMGLSITLFLLPIPKNKIFHIFKLKSN